nr:hypothetical protein BaRGS_032006 [Batillaria attramentaria]
MRVSQYPDVAREREVEGDVLLGDMGDGMPFKPGTFDGAIRHEERVLSFSFIQKTVHRQRWKEKKPLKNSHDWILQKKERRRKQGKEVPMDTKYTGRKRKTSSFWR